jgi:superfamily II DNA or RNA helicase
MSDRVARIYIDDHSKCRVDMDDVYILSPALQYATKTMDGSGKASYMNTRHGTFMTGFLPRILRFCAERNIGTELIHNPNMKFVDPEYDPWLKGIALREDQMQAIEAVSISDRGIIKAPTGTGKTVVMAGVISRYPSANWLVISHTSSLVLQTASELENYGLTGIGVVGAGTGKVDFDNHITVGTRQTIAKLKDRTLKKLPINGVIVDEAHHVVSLKNEYGHILKNLPNTCIRCGFTATLPPEHHKRLAMEGLIGPVISELTMEQAVELDLLAHPSVIIRRLPNNHAHSRIRNYVIAYRECVVENRAFHRMVITDLYNEMNAGKTGLVLVTEIRHGELLVELAKRLYDINMVFVHGGVPAREKERIRKQFIQGEIRAVVATSSWREGINIPTLGALFTAGQGKSELKVLQEIGRGLRKTKTKDSIRIYDYFNPNNMNLIAQFAERLCLFMDRKWLAGMGA